MGENVMNGAALRLAIASSVLGALAATSSPAAAAGKQESCYGVSLKGQNDCAAGAHSCSGQATADYSKADFKYVPQGTCLKINENGHKGSLTPS
jgi:uncharacterized membrane protein